MMATKGCSKITVRVFVRPWNAQMMQIELDVQLSADGIAVVFRCHA
ncbi:MAG: hypothetical protein U5K75_04540 [Ahrensia sp.]|nr:hypothetical protein [Ahrensia sp.]